MKQSWKFLLKETMTLKAWAFFKVPMLFFMGPVVRELSLKKAVISMGLGFRTKNHFNAMYMGALVGGADLAAGILAMKIMKFKKKRLSLAFKSVSADFIKRAESKVFFVCSDGDLIEEMIESALSSGERKNMKVSVEAFCPKKISGEPVAKFDMTLSVKPMF